MKILYIAYSCAPDRGSENRIGWMVPVTMARYHAVFVITKSQYRRDIETYCADHPQVRVQFFYVDVPVADNLLRGHARSLGLNLWHRRAVKLAAQLCRREGIQLIHQITPVEFRSIGDYGSIPEVRFLCGPVGGGEYIPRSLWPRMGRYLAVEGARWGLNCLARRRLKKTGILDRCHGLLFANPETEDWLNPILPEGLDLGVYPEVGVDDFVIAHRSPDRCRNLQRGAETPDLREGITFLTASRLIRRKGHRLLLDALASLPEELPWKLMIAGTGPEETGLRKKVQRLHLENRVVFTGKLPFSQMEALYQGAHVLVLPSLRETTGSVVTEAMARGLPVILPDRFGGGALVTEQTGWLYDGSLEALSAALLEAASDGEEVCRRGANAAASMKAHTWDAKGAYYRQLYESISDRRDDHDSVHCGARL